MALTTFKAVVKKKEGLMVEGSVRGFKVIVDEPEDLGGTNKAMNPVELLLCSLGSCQTILAASFAPKFNIKLEEFWVELEGDLDPDGFQGLADVRPGYSNIRYNFHIKSNASEDNVRKLVDLIEKRCPVKDTLANMVKLDNAKYTIEK